MFKKDKKTIINEGRSITNGDLTYGGFPKILKEINDLRPEDKDGDHVNDEYETGGDLDINLDDLLGRETNPHDIDVPDMQDPEILDILGMQSGLRSRELRKMSEDELRDMWDEYFNKD